MKPDINLIPDSNIHVIKPRLTQPEEVDQILMAMAAQDLAASSLIAAVASVSFGVMHRKSPPRLPDHYLFASGST